MKTTRTLIAAVMLFAATTAVFAQSTTGQLMKVNVPFSFSADNRSLPAGLYYVQAVTPEHAIALISANGKQSAIVSDLPNYTKSPSPESRLVFQRYGSEYFLTQVWTKGSNVERSPMISKRQAEVAHSGGLPETKVILAYAGK